LHKPQKGKGSEIRAKTLLGVQTYLHVLATDGCFNGNGSFKACSTPQAKDFDEPFRHEVFKMLKAEGKINDVVIENMMNWRHSGFNVYCGNAIWPHNEEGLENLVRYIIRASFSQERMTYIVADESADGVAQVIYESKDGKATKTFEALDWLAQLVTHIPNKGVQMVRYYGFYSNKSRGLRKKAGTDDLVPALIDSDILPKCSISRQKINVGNKVRFRYLNGYWFRLIDASICWVAAEVDTQFAIFPCYAPNKQCLFFFLP